jgi:hypothetical protein
MFLAKGKLKTLNPDRVVLWSLPLAIIASVTHASILTFDAVALEKVLIECLFSCTYIIGSNVSNLKYEFALRAEKNPNQENATRLEVQGGDH